MRSCSQKCRREKAFSHPKINISLNCILRVNFFSFLRFFFQYFFVSSPTFGVCPWKKVTHFLLEGTFSTYLLVCTSSIWQDLQNATSIYEKLLVLSPAVSFFTQPKIHFYFQFPDDINHLIRRTVLRTKSSKVLLSDHHAIVQFRHTM